MLSFVFARVAYALPLPHDAQVPYPVIWLARHNPLACPDPIPLSSFRVRLVDAGMSCAAKPRLLHMLWSSSHASLQRGSVLLGRYGRAVSATVRMSVRWWHSVSAGLVILLKRSFGSARKAAISHSQTTTTFHPC